MQQDEQDRVSCEDFATCGVAQFQNQQYWKNQKQQDSYFVVEDVGATFGIHLGQSQRVALFGVADGHGEYGEIAANFVRRNLPLQLAQSPHFAAGRLSDAFLDSFTQTELLQQAAGLPLWASGTCVSAAAVSPTHIVVANCGDCRCVVEDQGTAQDLSNDHNVEHATPEEIQRILKCGGTIMPDKRVTMPGAPGRLATTRSLGDYWAKPHGPPENHIISGLPEIRSIERRAGQQFLVLATDGIFGFMSSQDVVNLCCSGASQVSNSGPLSRLAHTALCTAVNARRSDDNCTCLVVNLPRIEAHQRPRSPMSMHHELQADPRVNACGVAVSGQGSCGGGGGSCRGSTWQGGGCGSGGGGGCCQGGGCHGGGSIGGACCGKGGGCGGACAFGNTGGGCGGSGFSCGGGGGGCSGGGSGSVTDDPLLTQPSTPQMARQMLDDKVVKSQKDGSDVSLSSLVAPDEVCWCPWCCRQNRDGFAENIVLGSFERWREHMHEQHFDKLGGGYGHDEIVPCYWCCRPCVTKKGQSRAANKLPFWGSHERVCRDNQNRPALATQARSTGSSSLSGAAASGSSDRRPPQDIRRFDIADVGLRSRRGSEFLDRGGCGGGGGGGHGSRQPHQPRQQQQQHHRLHHDRHEAVRRPSGCGDNNRGDYHGGGGAAACHAYDDAPSDGGGFAGGFGSAGGGSCSYGSFGGGGVSGGYGGEARSGATTPHMPGLGGCHRHSRSTGWLEGGDAAAHSPASVPPSSAASGRPRRAL
eukprot:TRINITY_DN18918_c1_g3_i1.p1 TRINITY_DN18918_c1_g3~~TRINITY_DN18918_c1_g3_i1.p1  ORF type:complete len:756 (-),score=153.42 TRINITY_DN18918_c1_g3_i1:29-2296(-)